MKRTELKRASTFGSILRVGGTWDRTIDPVAQLFNLKATPESPAALSCHLRRCRPTDIFDKLCVT